MAEEPQLRFALAHALYLSATARNTGDRELSGALEAALESVALYETLREEGGGADDETDDRLEDSRRVAADLFDKLGRPDEASRLGDTDPAAAGPHASPAS